MGDWLYYNFAAVSFHTIWHSSQWRIDCNGRHISDTPQCAGKYIMFTLCSLAVRAKRQPITRAL